MSWKVGELAKATGMSIRTLHYYDEIGLLSPSYRTPAGHRLYGTKDVVRLQQIASLRQLGFSLDEIRDCLNSADFSPQHVLGLHISRLKEQVAAEQKLCARLEAIAVSLGAGREVSVEELFQTIEEISHMEKYYTPEQIKEIKERGAELGPEGLRRAEADWQQLMEEVRAEMTKGTDPATERVQQLARRWTELGQAFTGGDPEMAKAVSRMWQEEENIHGVDTSSMREMMSYISRAVATKEK